MLHLLDTVNMYTYFNDISIFCANPFAVMCVSLYFMILHVLGNKITKNVMNSILYALIVISRFRNSLILVFFIMTSR